MRTLARAATGESQVFDELRNIPTQLFPAKSQLIVVTPLTEDDPPHLVDLRARGYEVMVISPNPLTFELMHTMPTEAGIIAFRIARIERALLIDRLRHAGIRVLSWDVRVPFAVGVGHALAHPAAARPQGMM